MLGDLTRASGIATPGVTETGWMGMVVVKVACARSSTSRSTRAAKSPWGTVTAGTL
jgi:hypothetical protein